MKKGLFGILLTICSGYLSGQDSCFLFPTRSVGIITNPSFEVNPAGCTSGYFNEQGLSVPGWTTPTSEVLTGYLNACTNFLVPDSVILKESFANVYMYMFPLVPQPVPDGSGVAAVADFAYDGNTHEYPFRKSYVSTCLNSPLLQDTLYRLDFYVGFGLPGTDTLAIHNAVVVPEMSLNAEKFTLFGYTDCTNINIPIIGCPEVSGWTVLGSCEVRKTSDWVKTSISFRAPANLQSIALGPSCDTLLELNPPIIVVNADTVVADHYSYFLDDLQLNESTVPFPSVKMNSGNSCSDSIVLGVGPAVYQSGYRLQWYKNGLALSGEQSATLAITRGKYGSGDYQCQVSSDSICLVSDSVPVTLTVIPSPTVLGGSDTLACIGDTVRLDAFTDSSSSYSWQDGSSLPYFTTTQSGLFSVTISNSCGTANAQKNVHFEKCNLGLSIPNAFTPNGDGKNDLFKVTYYFPITSFKINIYSRYGQLLFTTIDPSVGWDGDYSGRPQPGGTYVYMVQFTDYKNQSHLYKGTLELIR